MERNANEKIKIENLKLEAEQAERNGDYGKVAEIRYGKIKDSEEKLAEFEKELQENISVKKIF